MEPSDLDTEESDLEKMEEVLKRRNRVKPKQRVTQRTEQEKKESLTAEKDKIAIRKQKRREYDQLRRKQATPEQKAARNEKRREWLSKKREAGELPVRKNQKKVKVTDAKRERQRFYNIQRRATMSEEKKEEIRQQQFLYREATRQKRLWANLPLTEVERKKKLHEDWKANLTGEKKQRHLESVARAVKKASRKQYEKLKQDPEKWEEVKKKQRDRIANETPEEKEKRRNKDKVNVAKTKLRNRLTGEGVPQEEVDREVEDLGEKMWREFYPEGNIPPPKKRGRPKISGAVVPVEVPAMSPRTGDDGRRKEEEIDNFPFDNACSLSGDWSPPTTPVPFPPGDVFEEEGHHTTPPEEISVPCSHCPLTFPSDLRLRSHIIFNHPKKCCQCPICQEVVLSPQELSEHYSLSHKTRAERERTQNLILSSKSESQTGNFVCVKCPADRAAQFRTRAELFDHVKGEHSQSFWPCRGCRLLKYSSRSLSLHHSMCRHPPVNRECLMFLVKNEIDS